MSASSRLAAVAAGLLLSALGTTTASADIPPVSDPVPVGPGITFAGTVNGATSNARILTSCFGPITPGETGHPLAGQYVEAVSAANSGGIPGYTGTAATQIAVTLTTTTSASTTALTTLYDIFLKVAIPTNATVPCAGSGTVGFTPLPTSPTARTATVSVTLVSEP